MPEMIKHFALLGFLMFAFLNATQSQNCLDGHLLENIPTFNQNQIASSRGVVYGNAINYAVKIKI